MKDEKDQSILRGIETKAQETKAENQELEFEKRKAEVESDVWKKRLNELETEVAVRGKHEVELEKELDAFRTNCDALSEELNKMVRDEKEKYDLLKAENHDLQFEKRKAEAEIDDWKKRICELESRVLRGTTLICRASHVSGVIESEPGGLPIEVSHNDEKDVRNKTIKLQSGANGEDIIGALVVDVTGAPSIDMQSLPQINVEEDLEFGKEFGKQLVLELEENKEMQSVLERGSIRPVSGRIIVISDDSSDSSPVKEKDLAPKKCVKRLYSNQNFEIFGSRCNEDCPFTSSPKRKRSSETPKASCGGPNVEEKNGWAERIYPNEHTSLSLLDMSGSDSSDSGYSSSDSSDSSDSENLQMVIDNALKKIFNRDN